MAEQLSLNAAAAEVGDALEDARLALEEEVALGELEIDESLSIDPEFGPIRVISDYEEAA